MGFSLGAVLARLIAQKYSCRILILASMTPLACFEGGATRKALVDLLGEPYVADIQTKLLPSHKAQKQVILYGDKEGESADILVEDTEHELSANYLERIASLL